MILSLPFGSAKLVNRAAAVCLLTAALNSLPAAPEAPSLGKAWQEASSFLVEDAYNSFVKIKETDPVRERERALGEAVTLLNKQPRTSQNILNSESILKKLAQITPKDDAAISASYTLARIYQFHGDVPRPADARVIYRDLLEHSAGHPLAENSAGALVLLELYENVPAAQRASRFDEMEKVAGLLKTSQGRRQYHLNLGQAYVDFGLSKSKAIEHLRAADAEGITRWRDEAATWIAIAELARAEKLDQLAAEYYQKFLAKYQRDNRSFTVQQRLQAITSPQATLR